MVIQLAEFSWSARNASRIYEVNCITTPAPNGAEYGCSSRLERPLH